jgi:hypothetical protein
MDDDGFVRQLAEERRRLGHWHPVFPRARGRGLLCADAAELFSLAASRRRYRSLAAALERAHADGRLGGGGELRTRSMGGIDLGTDACAPTSGV